MSKCKESLALTSTCLDLIQESEEGARASRLAWGESQALDMLLVRVKNSRDIGRLDLTGLDPLVLLVEELDFIFF